MKSTRNICVCERTVVRDKIESDFLSSLCQMSAYAQDAHQLVDDQHLSPDLCDPEFCHFFHLEKKSTGLARLLELLRLLRGCGPRSCCCPESVGALRLMKLAASQ